MIFSVNMRRLPARIFAVIMAVVIAFVFVSSDAHPTSVAAEEPVYISEVKLFYGYDLNDAVSNCKKDGYIPLEKDLNKSAYENQSSSVKNHTTKVLEAIYGKMGSAVVLGYKTTLDRNLAITDISMLQMGLGYDSNSYEDYLKANNGKFVVMAKTIIGLKGEFKANYEKGSPAAKMALRLLNFYNYDEKKMGLGDYILSDKCTVDDLSYLLQHTNVALVNTIFGAMTPAVADYNPDTKFSKGEFKNEVQPAEPLPKLDLPEISSSAADTSSALENNSSADTSSTADTSSVTDTSSAADTSSVTDSSSAAEKSPAADSSTSEPASVKEEKVVISCDPNYGTWADRVSKTGVARKFEESKIDDSDVKAYASAADVLVKPLRSFAANYQNALARASVNGKATDVDLGTEEPAKMPDKLIERAAKYGVEKEKADDYYLGIYDMLATFPYDENMNLAEYIVDLGSRDYASAEDKYCLYPLAAAMTHGQVQMVQYNGVEMLVSYLFNNDNLLKEFDKYADSILETIHENKGSNANSISVWEGIDKSIFKSNIAETNNFIIVQATGRINDDVKKPYGVQTWLSSIYSKLTFASEILGGVNAIISIGVMISTHTIVGSFTPAACLAYAASGGALASVLGYTGFILLTSAMVLGIVTVALLVIITVADKLIDYLEKDAMDYVEVPAFVVDTNNNQSCLYSVVKGSNGQPGDVSAGMGKPAGRFEWATDYFSYLNVYTLVFGVYIPYSYKPDERPRWNALYYTHDPAAGSPLMLDSNGECFKVQYNNSTVPAGTKALTTFGEAVPANMNSYVNEDNADSIYVYYTTEDTLAKINNPTQNTTSEQEYINSITLCCAESETEAKTTLKRAGCNVIDTNLSPGREKNYTYLGYKTQLVEKDAVTDIRMGLKTSASDSQVFYGIGSYANSGSNKRGDSLYYSCFTQMGDALTTDFQIVNDVKDAKEGYEPITSFGGLPYNFNQPPDYEISNSSKWFRDNALFAKDVDHVKENVGKPVYVFFKPSKTYTKQSIEKQGGTAQEYISGMEIYECVPYVTSASKVDKSSTWDMKTYTDYVYDYAKTIGADVKNISLLSGIKYERGYEDILNGNGALGEPRTYMLITKTYNPKRALYDIRSYTSSPDSSGNPCYFGGAQAGGYAAAGVMLATVAREENFYMQSYLGYTATHDYLNFMVGMYSKNFDNDNSGLKMLPEDFEKQNYWKDAPYSKVYQNYKDQVTREYTYLRCKNIYLQGAIDNKNPLTPADIAFTNKPLDKNDGKVETLAGSTADNPEEFFSIQDFRTPNATGDHDIGFRGADPDGKFTQQYIYLRRKPKEKQYISSVAVGSFDAKEIAGKDASSSTVDAYSKIAPDRCVQILLGSCTDEILPYNLCSINAANRACIESFTDTLMSEKELQKNIYDQVVKTGYKHYTTRVNRYTEVKVNDTEEELKRCMKLEWQFNENTYKNQHSYAYLGVSRTDNASEAVTGLLRMKATAGKAPDVKVFVNGNEYSLCGGKISDKFLGDYYLYQTYNSGAGAPLTAVDFGIVPYTNDAATALYAEKSGISTSDSAPALGCGYSSNYIYGYYNDVSEYIDAVYIGTGDSVFEACSDLLAAGAKKAILYDVRHNAKSDVDGKYTFIGYSTSKPIKHKTPKGVRDIVFVKYGKETAPPTTIIGGREYVAARNGSNAPEAINKADGTYIYYYAPDDDTSIPMINKLGISERDRVPDQNETWENVLTSDNNRYNLNEGLFSFKSNTKFLTDSRAYLFCRRQSNPDNYIKPGAAIVGGHCESSIAYGDLYIEPAS